MPGKPYKPSVPDRVAAAEPGKAIGILMPTTDANGRPVTVHKLGAPAHGTAVLNADGTVTYIPAPGFAGVDSFTYEVVDAEGNVAMATITVTVGKPALPPTDIPAPGILPLPVTGDDIPAVITAGAITVAIGGVLYWVGARRPTD